MTSVSRFHRAAFATGVLSILVACGGGGGGDSSGGSSTSSGTTGGPTSSGTGSGGGTSSSGTDVSGNGGAASAQNAPVGGLWSANFTAANGVAVQAKILVTEDGRFIGASQNLSNNCAAIGYGSLVSNGSTFTGNGVGGLVQASVGGSIPACVNPDGTTSSTSSVSGSVVPRSSITWTATGTSSGGLALGTTTTTAQFDSLYNAGSSLAAISGSWTGPTGNLITMNASGLLAATDIDTACVLSGQVSIIDPAYNAYSATGTISGCNANASMLNGAAIKALMFIDNTTTPNKLIVGQEVTLTSGTKVATISTSTR